MNWRAPFSGFAGRLFLWFWLSLTLLMLANFFIGRYLDDRQTLHEPSDRDLRALERLQQLIGASDIDSPEQLQGHRYGQSLVLLAPQTLQPLFDKRLYWRLAPLAEAEEVRTLYLRPGHKAIGPFQLQLGQQDVLAIWVMPPRRVAPWKQLLHDSPHWRLLASMLLVLALSLIVARWLSRPVRLLSRAARQLGDGDLNVRVAPIKGELGELGREFNAMAEKLQASINSQQRLLADVSHELRSPLTRLKLAAGLLSERDSNTYTERIEKECDTLEHLIEQVLTLARLEGSVYQEDYEPTDIAAQVISALEDWRFQRPGPVLVYHGPKQARALANPRLLQRILDNLLANATRYGTEVHVHLAVDENRWQLTLEDNGPGVAADQLDKLFEPFFRGDSARSHGGNIGLGLAIVQAAAQAQRIHIQVQPSALGGLKFSLNRAIT
ncbi:ATP-binding protein [Gilvimarinus algae]|uniref:histidine kinase n=1 Tax=Gilvimarinus algae TaxID=3058037 RepID=A0ABT8TD23_9GAMM|nr:ATP-binding protein [Gilvimarinus sp. SDUM040014]MDO3381846.1 ATP-binding protein [Gilvimarinus sp. SDUM040014]